MDFSEYVLAAATGDLGEEPAARADADALEFRMDLASEPLSALHAYEGRLPLIATNRVEAEGGTAEPGQDRLDALAAAAAHPKVEAVDVELAAVEAGRSDALLATAAAEGAAVVVSAHDFEATPDRSAMDGTLKRAGEHGDVGKLAVTPQDTADVLALLDATRAATAAGRCVATMAMGELGRHSRPVAPIYGSRIGYAPVDPDRATGPGQYDLATLRTLVDRLSPRSSG